MSIADEIALTPEQAEINEQMQKDGFPYGDSDEPFAQHYGYAFGIEWISGRAIEESITGPIMFEYHRILSVIRHDCTPYSTSHQMAASMGYDDIESLLADAGLRHTPIVAKYTESREFIKGFCNGVADANL